jgi:hypothetical protein
MIEGLQALNSLRIDEDRRGARVNAGHDSSCIG